MFTYVAFFFHRKFPSFYYGMVVGFYLRGLRRQYQIEKLRDPLFKSHLGCYVVKVQPPLVQRHALCEKVKAWYPRSVERSASKQLLVIPMASILSLSNDRPGLISSSF